MREKDIEKDRCVNHRATRSIHLFAAAQMKLLRTPTHLIFVFTPASAHFSTTLATPQRSDAPSASRTHPDARTHTSTGTAYIQNINCLMRLLFQSCSSQKAILAASMFMLCQKGFYSASYIPTSQWHPYIRGRSRLQMSDHKWNRTEQDKVNRCEFSMFYCCLSAYRSVEGSAYLPMET